MAFYDNYVWLCSRINKSPSRVAIENGISKSNVTYWKDGRNLPSDVTLKKLSDYFGVTVDCLLDGEKLEDELPPVAVNREDLTEDVWEYLDMLRNRPECRMLLRTCKGATKEEVEENVKIIDAIRCVRNAD